MRDSTKIEQYVMYFAARKAEIEQYVIHFYVKRSGIIFDPMTVYIGYTQYNGKIIIYIQLNIINTLK